ncbi:homeotic protein spalt-major [Eurosta solidaginis]|uniref:homeotic protein spalt-major n=1 Tax=Eurosta solidaginis TaxID=178769 RepID=UPI003530DFD9
MCSIFHNRINYRGLRSNSNGSSNSSASLNNGLTKDFDADGNNNSGGALSNNERDVVQEVEDEETKCQDDCKAEKELPVKSKASTPECAADKDNDRQCEMGASSGELIERVSEVCEEDGEVEEESELAVSDSNEALDLSVLPGNQMPASGHVALEALQHTKVAVAQFAASALGGAQNYGEAMSELAMVQSTILNVQRQHLMQLQLIQHLQSQLKRAGDATTDEEHLDEQQTGELSDESHSEPKKRLLQPVEQDVEDKPAEFAIKVERTASASSKQETEGIESLKPSARNEENTKTEESKKVIASIDLDVCENVDHIEKLKMKSTNLSATTSTPLPAINNNNNNNYQPLLCDISSTLASSIITNHDPPPAPNEPNCLEMLQRRTEEVLDSASQSLHASHLQDEYEYTQKDAQGRGEIFKHRCKYCGKIFGSFSALQIHLRSHTGERPFHCNVCGSKFTTKGNLKVHYQRHTQIFPPMLMAHGPGSSVVEPFPPYGAPVGGAALMPNDVPIRFPVSSEAKAMDMDEPILDAPPKEKHEELSQQPRPVPTQVDEAQTLSEIPQDLRKPHLSPVLHEESEATVEAPKSPMMKPVTNLQTKLEKPETASTHHHQHPPHAHHQSKRSSSARKRSSRANTPHSATSESRKSHAHEEREVERDRERLGDVCDFPPKSTASQRRCSISRNSSNSGLEPHISSEYSLAQMERIIDKSWEDLIEIDTTSETSKLQQLVDNIENKLTDPNQCIFCHKVMSCRSSLQMHIRTHTGERPFRCKICGRAFATKGNLKAHMSIHKIKPPMRSQFKCPVCHQKFSNGIILQQHIRIHTIDDGSGAVNGFPGVALNGGVFGAFSLPLGTLPGTPAAAEAVAEHNARMKAHMDAAIEDQNSNKSMGASDNFDFSTTSDYSGQRSESSQGDFDDFMTMDSTDDSRENTSSLTPFDRRLHDDYNEERAGEATERAESDELTQPMTAMVAAAAMDLTARGFPANGISQKAFEHLPMLGMSPNFLLMAAAREEMQMLGAQGKFPVLPFGPLGFMGLHPQTNLCNLCFKIFPNPITLEHHIQTEHTKDVANNLTTTKTTITAIMTSTTTTTTTSSSNNATTTSNSGTGRADRTSPLNAKLTVSSNLFPKQTSGDTSEELTKSNSTPKTNNQNNVKDIYSGKSSRVSSPVRPQASVSPTLRQQIKQEPETEHEHDLQHSKGDLSRSSHASITARTPTPTTTTSPLRETPTLSALRPSYQTLTKPSNSEQSAPTTTHSPFELSAHAYLTMPLQSNAEQSLMQMQLLSSLPHDTMPLHYGHTQYQTHLQNQQHLPSHTQQQLLHKPLLPADAHRFPANPLDFQQALMSVGPPNLNADAANGANQKHFCHVCRRNFSSSSALQIHMRTHTGDKPFQCNVCQKAFTTKGNLKVHMGTHMWTNPTSRRGRRMSLELPLHRPGSMPAEPDFMQRRPELFFPYLPPFFNGLQPKPGDLSTGAFPNLTPPHFPNGANAGKYPPGLLGLPPFLAPPYSFAGMPPYSHGERVLERDSKSPEPTRDENKRLESPTHSTAVEAPWHMLDKIKTENNQIEETSTTPTNFSSQLDEMRNETQRLVE